MESPSENTEPSQKEVVNTAALCQECGRTISQKTGVCYYCNREVDKETEKNLGLLLLDWQKQAAEDPEEREIQKLRKVLSIFMAIAASACITMGIMPGTDPFFPAFVHWGLGILMAAACWCFYFNSLTALLAVAVNLTVMIFYTNLIIKAIPRLVATAFISGLIVGLCTFTLLLIIIRIFKTKTVEL